MSTNDAEKPKIGAGHVSAMGRLGLQELRAAVYPGSNIAQQPEYGLYGTLTPGEVASDRKPDPQPQGPDEEPTLISDRIQRLDQRGMEPERADRDRSLDR